MTFIVYVSPFDSNGVIYFEFCQGWFCVDFSYVTLELIDNNIILSYEKKRLFVL